MAKKQERKEVWQITIAVSKKGSRSYFLKGIGVGADREKIVKKVLDIVREEIEKTGFPKPFDIELVQLETLDSAFIIIN